MEKRNDNTEAGMQEGRLNDQKVYSEQERNEKNSYEPERQSNIQNLKNKSVSDMTREETLELLLEVGKVAKYLETLISKETAIKGTIEEENKKADELRHVISKKARDTRLLGTLAAFLVVAIFDLFYGVVVAGIAWYVMTKTVINKDIEEHADENEANAQKYIAEHVGPLEAKLDKIRDEITELNNSGRIEWAIDIVGEDMFISECIDELYNFIKGRRADNLKEALNLYDNTKYRERMEEMQHAIKNASEISAIETAKQTSQMQQIEKNTHEAATAAKATAATTYGAYRNLKKINRKLK